MSRFWKQKTPFFASSHMFYLLGLMEIGVRQRENQSNRPYAVGQPGSGCVTVFRGSASALSWGVDFRSRGIVGVPDESLKGHEPASSEARGYWAGPSVHLH